ncbi:Glucan 1,4-alpha-glucosidase, starch-binding protein [Metarhizium album ARSEF 1941]|uniref:Glucoamylase n=1 Tax=Metarhizium album (strain ARSEF 1941) TaxID=1081103 RepID=A0A0B2WWG3_METAS|nr:Glucan 1,4-alpha-glucosidase, starch-binding protein [Metarhizium album ARSEF 1941]KHN97954.1 Glucan 1,4-alpha-glucosidase, starch-binding protein [Metarhizium album ARSEF 1941]
MYTNLTRILALTGLWLAGAAARRRLSGRLDLDAFIAKQNDISLQGVLANIGPGGSNAHAAAAGAVVASPSKSDPDYWYTWSRDSALTFKVLVELFIAGNKSLQPKIEEYITAQAQLQGLTNPSGGPDTGGLGEPKFHVNLTAFTGAWGRPQRDGPPLRATTSILYANWLLSNGGESEAANTVWPVIVKDLSYTVQYWNRTGFDLWEEVNGSSFFTLSASHRALVEGAALAKALGKRCPDCEASAPRILCFLQSFWANGYIDSNINVNDGRTGKDVNSILSSIHTFDPAAACTDSTFQPCSPRALANHKAVVDSFRTIYTVNQGRTAGRAAAVGRYSEDVYYNGNPWYLATMAAAEQMYAAAYQWKKNGYITVDTTSLPFFRDLVADVSAGTYAKDTDTFTSIIRAVTAYGDDFVDVVKQYTPTDGSLAEQYDRETGTPKSAAHLTWSYASFVGAAERRSGVVPPSWGEPNSNTVPRVCEASPRCDSSTIFNVKVTTVPGESILVVGSLAEVGNWSPADAIPLDASQYTPSNPLWSAKVTIPAATNFEYKYIKKTNDGRVVWESDPNRSAASSTGCNSTKTLNDQWR